MHGIAQQAYKEIFSAMGCNFTVTVVADSHNEANSYIHLAQQEINRIEKRISSWDHHSETSAINNAAGIKPVVVSKELYNLIERSLFIAKLTDGAFDISYAAVDPLWEFDGASSALPTDATLQKALPAIGYENIVLDRKTSSIFLKKAGMKIGFGAIGKGYAADKAKELLKSKGVIAGIINASGDMNTWGRQPNGKPWEIAIVNPLNKGHIFATLPLIEGAVVTSGDYEKFTLIDNKRRGHIINPKTGYPTKGLISVTVFAPQAELADALATAIFVMGKEIGMDRIAQLPNVSCILIDNKGNISTSDNIKINP